MIAAGAAETGALHDVGNSFSSFLETRVSDPTGALFHHHRENKVASIIKLPIRIKPAWQLGYGR
jgi:hypothetical protein